MKLFSVIYCVVGLSSIGPNTEALDFSIKDLSSTALQAAKGIASTIPDIVPSPNDFFQLSKNVVAGYPFEIAASIINQFCKCTHIQYG